MEHHEMTASNDGKREIGFVQKYIWPLSMLWAGWASAMIVAHSIAISECKTWRQARPSFVTSDQQKLDLLQKEKELREMFNGKITDQFRDWDVRYVAAMKLNEDAHTRIIDSLTSLKDQITLLAERQVTSMKTLEKLEKGKQ